MSILNVTRTTLVSSVVPAADTLVTSFDPSAADFSLMLHRLWSGVSQVVSSVPSVSSVRQFEAYTAQAMNTQSVEDILGSLVKLRYLTGADYTRFGV